MTERRHADPNKRRLIIVPETEPYVSDPPPRASAPREAAMSGPKADRDAPTQPDAVHAASPHEVPTARVRPVRDESAVRGDSSVAPDSAGRYSHVYGRGSPSRPPSKG